MNEEERREIRLINERWKNRRRMAFIALFSILIVTYLTFFVLPIAKLKLLDNVITWFYTIMGGIVGAYMGLSTFEDMGKNKSSPPPTKKKVDNPDE